MKKIITLILLLLVLVTVGCKEPSKDPLKAPADFRIENETILFTEVENATHSAVIKNKETNKVDFKNYAEENNFGPIDYVFILLTWNGQYAPYNKDFSVHDEYSSVIINQIHKDFPNAKIGLMGIQLPCPNGGITACYGANGYYHDWYGETITAFNYNEFLEEKCKRDEYKEYVEYFDTKAQFDAEYTKKISLWFDIKVFFKTIVVVLKKEGNIDGKIKK